MSGCTRGGICRRTFSRNSLPAASSVKLRVTSPPLIAASSSLNKLEPLLVRLPMLRLILMLGLADDSSDGSSGAASSSEESCMPVCAAEGCRSLAARAAKTCNPLRRAGGHFQRTTGPRAGGTPRAQRSWTLPY